MGTQAEAFRTSSATGKALWGPGDIYTFLVSGEQTADAYFVMEALVPPGGGPPPHIHSREDEALFILDGECEVQIGETRVAASAGDLVNLPRGTPHSFANTGNAPMRMILTFVPAGIERFFEEVFDPVEDRTAAPPPVTDELVARLATTGPRYGIEFLPPPA